MPTRSMITNIQYYLRWLLRQPRGLRNNALSYWEMRAQEYGKRAVLNLTHSEDEFDAVTQWQKDILYPHFRSQLRGNERLVLDFGCGPGRFTVDLARMIHGRAVGTDPIEAFLYLAPRDHDVIYLLGDETKLPLGSASVDIVWICLVLGGLSDQSLNNVATEVQRVLCSGGLLFLVENTSSISNCAHWTFRPIEQYRSLFPKIKLEFIGSYEDAGEDISIMTGRSG